MLEIPQKQMTQAVAKLKPCSLNLCSLAAYALPSSSARVSLWRLRGVGTT